QLQLNWATGIILNPGTAWGKSYVDIQGNGLRVTAGNVGIGTTSPSSLFSVGSSSQFQISTSGVIVSSAGITSSGSITFSGLSTAGIVHNNASGVLSTSKVSLTAAADVTGVLPVANGGTGTSSSPTAGGIIYGSSSTAYGVTGAGTSGQVLISNGAGAPTWATLAPVVGWGTSGNSGTTAGTNFIGTTDAQDIVLKRFNEEGLRVTTGGALLATGNTTTGVTPASGNGTRMMWIPAKSAFRAGIAGPGFFGSYVSWDDINIGIGSAAFGNSSIVKGNYAFASGTMNFAQGLNSVAFGNVTGAFADMSSTFGQSVSNSSYCSFALGQYNNDLGLYNKTSWVLTDPLFVIGNGTTSGSLSNALTVLKNGNTGIGAIAPEDLLQVGLNSSKAVIGSAAGSNLSYGTSYIGFNASRQSASTWSTGNDLAHNGGAVMYGSIFGDIRFSTIPSTGTTNQTGIADATIEGNTKLLINNDGNVGIGVTDIPNAAYKLTVCGAIHAKKLVIETGWCDFVFDKDYKLMTIAELSDYVKANKHLPNIPSAKDVETNGGDIGELVKLQMQKIEELSLYVIQLKEENEKIKELIKTLKK
ncbi:MAG: hypothetical protein ACXVED_11305, partial [Bacteroidia bacterium]